MNPNSRLVIALTAAGGLALVGGGVWFLLRHWRRKDPAEIERLRRLDVNRKGRICAARIIDFVERKSSSPLEQLLVYQYDVAGVTYEAAQEISLLPQVAAMAQHLPGMIASVKYDPKRPMNSIITCENWSGIPNLTLGNSEPVQEPSSH